MPLYEMNSAGFQKVSKASFTDLKVRERGDIQRLLRNQIDILDDDLYVLAEEFGDWEDSRRRIDLLAMDREANLVVIELKRTHDGGHMDLQAVRYASMVSPMTFERAELIHSDYLEQIGSRRHEAGPRMLQFLDWDEPNEEIFNNEVRIILVSEDFGIELTTAVLWLREHEIDIRCVRLCPYLHGESKFIDVQQVIPLPEANEYQVQVREKEQHGRKHRAERHDLRFKFWQGVVTMARTKNTRHGKIKPGVYSWLGASSGIRGLGFNFGISQDHVIAELYIDRGDAAENKKIFDQLYAQRKEIETTFGDPLSWERLEDRQACRIKYKIDIGGYRSPEAIWPQLHTAMVDGMIRLESTLKPALDKLDI